MNNDKMETIIDLSKRFEAELCTFEVAKKARAAGMTCANTFLSYDENGERGDGAWLEKITGSIQYPCINFPLALMMMEGTDLDFSKVQMVESEGKFVLKYNGEKIESGNIVDTLILAWIKHKKKEKNISDN